MAVLAQTWCSHGEVLCQAQGLVRTWVEVWVLACVAAGAVVVAAAAAAVVAAASVGLHHQGEHLQMHLGGVTPLPLAALCACECMKVRAKQLQRASSKESLMALARPCALAR